jgi:hypothetical protein
VLNRLALALQIGFLKMTGGPLNSVEIIPRGIAIIGRAKIKIQCCWVRLTICSKLHAKRDQCIVARVRRFGAKVAASFVSHAIAPGVRCRAGPHSMT